MQCENCYAEINRIERFKEEIGGQALHRVCKSLGWVYVGIRPSVLSQQSQQVEGVLCDKCTKKMTVAEARDLFENLKKKYMVNDI